MRLSGTFTALITPFKGDKIDEEGLVALLTRQIEAGVQGVVLLGTTGEGTSLDSEEQERVISLAVKHAKNRLLLIVGTGSNSTKATIEKTKKAKQLGADCALVVTPYYNKPTQEGIFHHYEALSQAVNFPILLYNIPVRCAVNIEAHTMARLACLPNVIGVKESSGNLNLASEYLHIDPDFIVLAGDDALALPMIALGACGVISVASNLVPNKMSDLIQAALRGDFLEARRRHYELLPLFRAEFIETNPIPIKEAMEIAGLPSGGVRLPLWKLRHDHRNHLQEVVEALEIETLLPQ